MPSTCSITNASAPPAGLMHAPWNRTMFGCRKCFINLISFASCRNALGFAVDGMAFATFTATVDPASMPAATTPKAPAPRMGSGQILMSSEGISHCSFSASRLNLLRPVATSTPPSLPRLSIMRMMLASPLTAMASSWLPRSESRGPTGGSTLSGAPSSSVACRCPSSSLPSAVASCWSLSSLPSAVASRCLSSSRSSPRLSDSICHFARTPSTMPKPRSANSAGLLVQPPLPATWTTAA
mmetsp:Transcript_32511/g.93266  ORF Transcript_32511/g.93266 Transcript_32511/m.93266 type:complete len:240 (-) Transcript_32511:429-1148(-)